MHQKLIPLCSLILLFSTPAISQPYKTEPAAYKDCAELPQEIKPMFCDDKPTIAFLISGDGLIDIKRDSLVIKTMKLGNEEISKNRFGESIVKTGPFPKTSKDGKFLTFDITIDKPLFGQLQKVKLDGEITVLTSNQLIEKKSTSFNLNKPFSFTLGEFKIDHLPEQIPAKKTDAKDGVKDGMHRMFMGGSDGKTTINLYGNIDALISLDIVAGDKVIKSRGSSSTSLEKSLNYDEFPKNNAVLVLKYWSNIKEVKIPFKL